MCSLPPGVKVLVLDAQSSDRTCAIAREHGAAVVERAWTDFVDARRFALTQATTPWTLFLDADERLDAQLCAALLACDGARDGYTVTRDTYVGKCALRMWRGETLLRFVRTERAQVAAFPSGGGAAALHERILCSGSIGGLCGTLIHHSYVDLQAYREKYARYIAIEAEALEPSHTRAIRASVLAPVRALVLLLRRGALLDGPVGWYVAWRSAWYPAAVSWKALRH